MTTITGAGILIGSIAPYTALGTALGLAPLPGSFWWILAFTVIAYLVLVQIVKKVYVNRHGELLINTAKKFKLNNLNRKSPISQFKCWKLDFFLFIKGI